LYEICVYNKKKEQPGTVGTSGTSSKVVGFVILWNSLNNGEYCVFYTILSNIKILNHKRSALQNVLYKKEARLKKLLTRRYLVDNVWIIVLSTRKIEVNYIIFRFIINDTTLLKVLHNT